MKHEILGMENARLHIVDHINQWRKMDQFTDPRIIQRCVDSVDALQQLHISLFGCLAPDAQGGYPVTSDHGAGETVIYETSEQAMEAKERLKHGQ